MKRLHLISNAHLDPVWMWDWEEGAAAALATFYAAAELAEEFEYIFCHNEAILYKFVERYDPALFERIRTLVHVGKWHVMGGWYLQPDCHMPAGESLARQMLAGREWFREKFGVEPTAAVNVDSFGHSWGLPQILKKCGFDSYLFCRPTPDLLVLPGMAFLWEGCDGSRVKAVRAEDDNLYASSLGRAKEAILRKAAKWQALDAGIALWGVGNHGGGPSRKDLRDIGTLMEQADCEVAHSTPERFFGELDPQAVFSGSLAPCNVGCYSSMSRLKQKHVALENRLYMTEKICAASSLLAEGHYPFGALEEAQEDLLFIEFHDILPGTCTAEGEASGIERADHGLRILNECFMQAFFELIRGQRPAGDGEFPIFVFNPHPRPVRQAVEVEFLIQEPLFDDDRRYRVTARQAGRDIPCQILKELSNISYDRRKRVALDVLLSPSGMTRLDLRVDVEPFRERSEGTGDIVVEGERRRAVISRKTGLLESYIVDGCEYLTGGAFLPEMYEDNEDPWGQAPYQLEGIGRNPRPFTLADADSPFGSLQNVRVIEEGTVLVAVESLFACSHSTVRLEYKLYRNHTFVDVTAEVCWNEQAKALKLRIPAAPNGDVIGQIAYGTEPLSKTGAESVAQRFTAVCGLPRALAVYNDGTYGLSFREGCLYLDLLRGACYCAHPMGCKPLIPQDRYVPYMEQGRHVFHFRLDAEQIGLLEQKATEFCQKPYALNAFPHGEGKEIPAACTVDNPAVALTVFKKSRDGSAILRLFNNSEEPTRAQVKVLDASIGLSFGRYEVKTLVYSGGVLREEKQMRL